MKIHKIITQGCKVNQYESRVLEEEFSRLGLKTAQKGEVPDIVVINTCTVTSHSDMEARGLVRRAKRQYPGARVVVAGCYAALKPEMILEAGAEVVLASADKENLVSLALSEFTGIKPADRNRGPLKLIELGKFYGRKRAPLKVQDGCECFCSYCLIPYARGPSRSLPPEEVAAGIANLSANGHREVVLTGVHLGYWGRDLTPPAKFTDLLEIAEKSAINRIRLSSLEPMEATDEVLAKMASSGKFCPHLHIPLQSGSDEILMAMKRPYDSEMARERIVEAQRALDGLCVGLDVITGFPGETDRHFEETLNFLRDLDFAYLHVFPFSPRPGTVAYGMGGQVYPPLADERAKILRALSKEKRVAFHRSQIGPKHKVLAEKVLAPGLLMGRTANYLEVEFPWSGQFPGELLDVTLVGWNGTRLSGKVEG